MRFSISPRFLRLALPWWPPFVGAGIRVTRIDPDWSYVRVELRQNPLNRNALGTHFGGSLFAMTDPFYALMLMHQLGRDYVVWDQSATIDFLKPGRGVVWADFRLEPELVGRLRHEAAGGAKLRPEFLVEVRNSAGETVARVRKLLYVRLKTAGTTSGQ